MIFPWSAKVLAVWGDVADPIQSEPVQPARHRPHAAREAVPVGELAGDTGAQDHFFVRRQDSISSSTQIGRRVGRFAGALE